MWQQWVNVILGLVVLAVPFLSLSATATLWTLVVTGIAIAVLALWGAVETNDEREHAAMIKRHA